MEQILNNKTASIIVALMFSIFCIFSIVLVSFSITKIIILSVFLFQGVMSYLEFKVAYIMAAIEAFIISLCAGLWIALTLPDSEITFMDEVSDFARYSISFLAFLLFISLAGLCLKTDSAETGKSDRKIK